MIYFYLLYAFSRFGRMPPAVGAWYPQWRAGVIMVVLQCWLVVILAAWIKAGSGLNLLVGPTWKPIAIAAVIVIANTFATGAKFGYYKQIFDRYSQEKRRRYDLLVAAFMLAVFAFLLFSVARASGR